MDNMFVYKDFTWHSLEDCDLAKLTDDLNHPLFVRQATLKYPEMSLYQVLAQRLKRSQSGEHINLVLQDRNGTYRGWVGLIGCVSDPITKETSTYLHPDLWGQGVNLIAKTVQWELGHNILGLAHLVISINQTNIRSVQGNLKLFPKSPIQKIFEPSKDRISVNIRMDRPPVGYYPMGLQSKKDLFTTVEPLTGYKHFMDNT